MFSARFGAFVIAFALSACAPAASQTVEPTPEALRPIALGFHVSREPVALTGVRVIDGDTFDAGLERFRVENLDTPEMGGRAHCPLEIDRSERAKLAAQAIFDGARSVIATPARGRRDQSGRIIARVTVDGRDFGELLRENSEIAQDYRRPPGWNWCVTPVAPCEANSEACGRASSRRRQTETP